jgi:tRNA pseudouridine55 synthase
LAYAGRLDPMAEGKMLILAGEACKEREKYLGLDKNYIFEVLLGFSSDSGDILGLLKKDKKDFKISLKNLKKEVEKNLSQKKGKRKMQYPVYSSKPVDGKPLFL